LSDTPTAAADPVEPLPTPIFVVGMRAADTAIVGAVVGCNPDALGLPELNLFLHATLEGLWLEMSGGRTNVHGLLRALAYIYASEQTITSVAMAQRWILRRLHWPAEAVFDELRSQVAPLRLVDKSNVYSHSPQALQRIRASCPDAYYIHVVDHPLTLGETSTGRKKRSADGNRPSRKAGSNQDDQLRWLEGQQRIADAIADVPEERRAVARMEDLITIPKFALEQLCQHLGLRYDAEAINAMRQPEASPFAGVGPVGANLGDDLAFLRNPAFPTGLREVAKRTEMLSEVAEFAAGLGYN